MHEVYIITDYIENKAISDLLNDVWKYQNYALYVTEWKMSKNIKTIKISVWHKDMWLQKFKCKHQIGVKKWCKLIFPDQIHSQ